MEQANRKVILSLWRDATLAFTVWFGLVLILNQFTYGFVATIWPIQILMWAWLVNLALFAWAKRSY